MDVNLCQQLVKILQLIILNRWLKYLEEKETNGSGMNILSRHKTIPGEDMGQVVAVHFTWGHRLCIEGLMPAKKGGH